jgi:hypothetical protein
MRLLGFALGVIVSYRRILFLAAPARCVAFPKRGRLKFGSAAAAILL